MGKALHKQFIDLIELIDNKKETLIESETRDGLTQLIENIAFLAEVSEEEDEFVNKLYDHLNGLYTDDESSWDVKLHHLKHFIMQGPYHIDEKKRSANRWKALGILIVILIESLVLSVILGAIGAVLGATIFFALALLVIVIMQGPILPGLLILKEAVLVTALAGAVLGAVMGVALANYLSFATLDKLKTTDWAGFEAHDSLWNLLVHGAGKKTVIAETVASHYAFFTQPIDNQQDGIPCTNEFSNSTNDPY